MGEMTNKTNRIRQNYRANFFKIEFTQGRIQCGKQLVGRVHIGICNMIEQSGFTGVGIPNQGHGGNFCPLARTSTLFPLLGDLLQAPQNRLDSATQ